MDTHNFRKKNFKGMRRFSLPIFSIALALSAASVADAEQDSSDPFETGMAQKGEPVHFSGDRLTYNLKSRIIEGSGRVEIVQGDATLSGERVVIDLSTGVAEIEGDVEVTRMGDLVTGEKGVYDFEKKEGVFYGARGHSKPWYLSADKIEREAAGHYTVANTAITTCDLPSPHYRLSSKTTTVFPGDHLEARRLFLYAGSIPIFYLPYYSHRLDGGAPPIEWEAGTESDLGAYARIGYNIELSEKVLIKPHVDGFTKSGVGGGLNGRLNLFDGKGRGKFESFYISDQNNDNTDVEGVEQDRGKVDVYYRQELPHDLTALLQIEYISDQEFLKTFDFDGFSDRELPESFINLERTSRHEVVSLTVRENLVDYTDDVNRSPELRLELLDRRVGDTGLFFSATNDIGYLDEEERDFQATRNFTEGRLRYPLRYRDWLGLTPFLEGSGTYYSETLVEDDEYRLSWDAGLVAQSRFHKIYDSPFDQYSAFRHLIVPTVTYRFRPKPDEEPDELPGFDSIDLIDKENSLEIEIRNYLQGKNRDGEISDILEYNFTAGLEYDDGSDKLATLENEVLVKPVPNWELAAKVLNDFRDERRSDLASTVLRYSKPESFRASAGFLHEDTLLKSHDTQIVYSLAKELGPLWRIGFEQRYSISDDEFTYHELWVWRDLHCWELLVRLRDRRESTSVMALVNIKAFPMRRIDRKIALNPIGENHPWPTRW